MYVTCVTRIPYVTQVLTQMLLYYTRFLDLVKEAFPNGAPFAQVPRVCTPLHASSSCFPSLLPVHTYARSPPPARCDH